MSRGTKITILIFIGIVVIGLIFYYVMLPVFFANQPATNTNTNTNKNVNVGASLNRNTPSVNAPTVNVPLPPEVSEGVKTSAAARTIAIAFAERLATYDNRHGFNNLNDLETIVTPAVWKYLSGDYRKTLEKTLPSASGYYATTATAIRANLVPTDDSTISAVVQLQRAETGTVSKTSFASLDLVLKKIEGNWLVARLDWEK